jgi:hypothetical protein
MVEEKEQHTTRAHNTIMDNDDKRGEERERCNEGSF